MLMQSKKLARRRVRVFTKRLTLREQLEQGAAPNSKASRCQAIQEAASGDIPSLRALCATERRGHA